MTAGVALPPRTNDAATFKRVRVKRVRAAFQQGVGLGLGLVRVTVGLLKLMRFYSKKSNGDVS